MKKRIAFLGAILSLMPITQSLIIKKSVVLSTSGLILSIQKNVKAESGDFYFERGIAKHDYGDYFGAIKDFNDSLRLNPNPKVIFNRANSKYALGDYKGAIKDYEKLIPKKRY